MPHSLTRTIYLDHAAATPLHAPVYEAMLPHLRDTYGNPASIHHAGRAAAGVLAAARASLASSLAVAPSEIILTGSGTESDNLAILGLARANTARGKHIIVSAIEHQAVLAAAAKLEAEGYTVTYLPVDEHGLVELAQLQKALRKDTSLVSIMYANNEIGTIEPIKEIAELLQAHCKTDARPLFHTDACQAADTLSIRPHELGVDALTLNSAKTYGPKGIGLLWVRSGVALEPISVGGHQEDGRRAGTPNVALAVGFAKALELAVADTETTRCRLAALRDHFLTELHRYVPSLLLNGHPTKRLANNVHLCIPHVEGESLVLMLDAAGICASTGSACNAADLEPSHVLAAIGRSEDIIHGSLRLTLGRDTTKADLTYTAKTLGRITNKLLTMTASGLHLTKHHAKNTRHPSLRQ